MEGQETDKSVCFLNAWTEQYHWMKGWKTSLISGHEFVKLSWRFSQTIYFLRASTRHSAYVRSPKVYYSYGHNATVFWGFFFYILFRICKRVRRSWYQYLFRHYWYYWNEDRKNHYFNIIWILRHCKIIKTIFFLYLLS